MGFSFPSSFLIHTRFTSGAVYRPMGSDQAKQHNPLLIKAKPVSNTSGQTDKANQVVVPATSPGVMPIHRLNCLVIWLWSENPHNAAVSAGDKPLYNAFLAWQSRSRVWSR